MLPPDLQLDGAAGGLDGLHVEVDPDGCETLAVEALLHVAFHQTGLPRHLEFQVKVGVT